MRIKSVAVWREDLALKKPYEIAYRVIDHVENVFVKIELENGVTGIGSGSPAPFVTGETIDESIGALEQHVERLLSKRDIRRMRAIFRDAEGVMSKTPAALAALDIALHDACARALGMPLYDLLGRAHHALPTSITIGIQSLADTLADAREHLRAGFKALKLKTGKDVETDIESFIRLREMAGPGIAIRVDINQGYDHADLSRFAQVAAPHDVEFYEQPLPAGQLLAMLELPEALRRQCAADEDLHGPADAIRLAGTPQPFGIFNIKLMKCGGLSHALAMAETARFASIRLMWGCNDESQVSIVAALHAALASPATRYLDLDGSFDLASDIADGGFELRDGYLYPNDRPGLGVVLRD
jgi:L-alanine-DL-glutamate epimerase-like enolase superfamily enzyme